MGRVRRKSDWLLVVAVCAALVLVPLGGYVGGYYWLGEARTIVVSKVIIVVSKVIEDGSIDHIDLLIRTYDSWWLASIYKPVGSIEESLSDRQVLIQKKGGLKLDFTP